MRADVRVLVDVREYGRGDMSAELLQKRKHKGGQTEEQIGEQKGERR
jgi:hypothetical protein